MCGFPTSRTRSPGGASIFRPITVAACCPSAPLQVSSAKTPTTITAPTPLQMSVRCRRRRAPPPPAVPLPAAARGPSVAAPPSPGPFWPSLPPLKISRTVSLASMIVRSAVKRSTYVDSVTLMLVQKEVRQQPGVTEAGLVVATDANRTLLRDAGLLSPEAEAAGPDDLVISVSGTSDNVVAAALALAEQLLTQRRQPTAAGEYRPRTIAAAHRMLPDATIAAISVPGRFAAAVAREALQEGLHVFLFSDNVSLEDELALKRMAAERGRLLMGPDCGTAPVGGVGLGVANKGG